MAGQLSGTLVLGRIMMAKNRGAMPNYLVQAVGDSIGRSRRWLNGGEPLHHSPLAIVLAVWLLFNVLRSLIAS